MFDRPRQPPARETARHGVTRDRAAIAEFAVLAFYPPGEGEEANEFTSRDLVDPRSLTRGQGGSRRWRAIVAIELDLRRFDHAGLGRSEGDGRANCRNTHRTGSLGLVAADCDVLEAKAL